MQLSTYLGGLRFSFQKVDALRQPFQKMVAGWDVFDIALNVTLLLLLFHEGSGASTIPLTFLGMAAILHRPLRHSNIFWLMITVVLAVSNYRSWFSVDNHQYLITYWCLALSFSLLTANPEKSIKSSARLLIGLAFLFATVWKLISNDYLSGTFFHWALLLDERFRLITELIGGLSDQVYLVNMQAKKELYEYDSMLQVVQFQDTPQLYMLAQFLTWWTIVIETVIAVAFLWPEDKLISKWRDPLLLLFLFTTYSAAPVAGFGWVLIAMGLVQCSSTFKYTRLFYMLAFFLIHLFDLLYSTPWGAIYPYILRVNSFF